MQGLWKSRRLVRGARLSHPLSHTDAITHTLLHLHLCTYTPIHPYTHTYTHTLTLTHLYTQWTAQSPLASNSVLNALKCANKFKRQRSIATPTLSHQLAQKASWAIILNRDGSRNIYFLKIIQLGSQFFVEKCQEGYWNTRYF